MRRCVCVRACVHIHFHCTLMCGLVDVQLKQNYSFVLRSACVGSQLTTHYKTRDYLGFFPTCPYNCDVGQQLFSNSLKVRRFGYTGRTQRTTVFYRRREIEHLVYFFPSFRVHRSFKKHCVYPLVLPVGQKRKTAGSPKNR